MSLKQPVRYPVKYYSHLDAGAPQLANAGGAIKAILKACLVTGYDTKAGAGWTNLFDDAASIVLRRPLRTGNPPDIKIENGVVNSVASHRIVLQDNPTGLDDPIELATGNLLARDSTYKPEWHLVASDFGFIFCYAMAEDGYAGPTVNPMDILYVGPVIGMVTEVPSMYFSYHSGTAANGTHGPWIRGFLSSSTPLKSASRTLSIKRYLTLSGSLPDTMQRIFFDTGESLPFYVSLKDLGDTTNGLQTLDGRPFLSVCNINNNRYERSTFYAPLDYWEL